MSTYSPAPHSIDGRTSLAVAATKRGLAILAAVSLVAGPAAAQATDAIATPLDLGRLALALVVVSAITLLKVWAYADKRGKLMDRLTGYLTARAAHRSHRVSTRAQGDVAPAPSQAPVPRGAQRISGFRVLPVPGLPSHLQYLSD